MKKRVLSLFLALTLCLTLTPTGALAAEGQPPEQTVSVTQEAQIPAPAAEEEEEEKKTTSAENGADENDPPANPEENPTENAPAAAEKNTEDKGTGKEAGQNKPTAEGENEPLTLGLGDAAQNAADGENGEAGGTSISEADTRTVIWRDTQWTTKISRPYDGTTDGSTVPLSLTFTDGTNEIGLKEGTDFTAVKTFDSAEVGDHTVTVKITLSGEAAAKYKLREAEERFTIDGTIDPAAQNLTLSLSKTTCAVGEKLLPLLSVSGVKEDAAVTYYYTQYKRIAGDSEFEGNEAIPKIDVNTVIDKLDEEGNNTYYVYARTAATQNYQEGMSNVLEFTVAEKVDPVASVTSADGTETTYGSFSDAWTAAIANNGSTLKLLVDATLPNGNTDLDQSLTLDLNGYVLGSNGSLTVKSGAALTVKNAGGEKSEKPVNVGLYLTLLVEKGGSFTCTDGGLRYLGLLSAGTGDYAIQLTEGESHCTFGGFAQGDANATVGDLLKATPGMALHADHNGSDVRIERSTRISSGFTYLSFYVGPCSEHQMDANGTCIYCGASYVASVTASGGVTTNYTSLDDALDAMKDGDTVTLLGDAEVTKWHSLSKAFTLELNGKTVTTQSKAELYLHARVIVQDSSTGKTGGMAGTALLNVQEGGDLIIKSGTFNGRITINVGKLTIKGGTFNQEVDLRGGDFDSVFFSGGTFAKIWYPNSSGSFLDLLADGCAFYDNDGKLVNVAEITGTNLYNVRIRPHQHTFTNGACGCGYTCPHTSVDESGACTVCGKQFAASITEGNDVTYYDLFNDALVYAFNNDGCTLKLLADVTGTTVMINNPFLFDLNGHSVDALSVDAKATIKDSGTTKGRIGKVTVSNEKVTDLTLGDLPEEGYAFRNNYYEWVDVARKDAHDVSVQKAPIQGLTIKTDKTTYTPGEMITLTATAQMSGTETVTSYQWTYDGLAMEQNPAGSSLQANQTQQKASGGTHTFTCTAYCGGYAFTSQPYTITVDPIDLSGATAEVKRFTYNGSAQRPQYNMVTVKLGDNIVQYGYYDVEATPQTDAGEYTLTITGTGNYTGKIENVPWKINPAELTVSAPSEVKKAYDGTTNATVTPIFNGLKNNENLTAADYSVTAAFEDAKVGYKKTVTGKVTLNQTDTAKNYVLNDENFRTDDGTIAKAAAPTVQPVELTIYNGVQKDYYVDLPPLPDLDEGKSYGTVEYKKQHTITLPEGYTAQSAIGGKVGSPDTKLLVLHMTQTGSRTGEIGTVTIPVTTSNYQDITLTVKVKAVNQIIPEKVGTVSAGAITYGQTLNDSTITFTGKMTDIAANEEVNGTFTWKDGAVKPDAGSYEAWWLFTPDESYGGKYTTNTGDVTVTVNKADAALTAPTANTLTYNGTEQALVSAGTAIGGTMQYRLGDIGDFSTDIPKAENAGNYTVYYKVVGDNNHNDSTVMNLTVTIDPMKIDHAKFVKDISKAYDGKPTFDLVAEDKASYLTFYDAHMRPISVPAEAYEISGVNFGTQDADHNFVPSAEVGDKPGIQFTVEFKSSNYVLQADDVDEPALALTYTQYGGANFTITKGDLIFSGITITNVPVQLLVTNDLERTYEIDLPKYRWPLAAPCEYGNVSYTLKENTLNSAYYSGGAEITAENKLILPINQVATDQELPPVGKVVVTVTSGNYKDYTITINVSPRNKVAPVPSGTIRASSITYGESLSKSKITGWMQHPTAHNDVKGVFRWEDDTIRPNAGDYVAEWIFIPDESYGGAYLTATGTATVTVNPKVVTVSGITANDKAYDGTTDAELVFSNATFDGIQGNDTLTATAKGKFANANVGNQPVTISDLILGGDSAANYVLATEGNQTETTATITAKEVTVTITPNGGTYGSVTAATAGLPGAVEGDNVPVTLTYTGNDYNSTTVPVNAGSYTVTASIADSNYVLTGETTANFVIEPKSIKDAKVVLGKALTANGAEQTQTVEKVLLDGKELPADSYTVTDNTATAPGSHTLTITAKGNYTGTVKQTYVIVPAKAEDAPDKEITIGNGKVKVDIKFEGTVPPASQPTDKAELLSMLVDSGDITADELAQIADGANVDIVLTVKEANDPGEVKTAMAQAAKDYTIGQYLDISLLKYMTVNGSQQTAVALRTTKNALTVSVVVPDALINTNSAVNRTYCIVRHHDGTIAVLDAVFDAASKTLTFKTDRFSDYAIAYKDTAVPGSGSNPSSNNSSNDSETKKNEVAAPTPAPTPASTSKPSTITAMPQTGDTSNPTLYVVLLVASLLGLAVVFVCKKRNDK